MNTRNSPQLSDATPCEPEQHGKLGTDNSIIRVLNFSGGGFDTVMQLGVTHALLVTQGRAPDIVVGVSAGAIQATALAEVMRAGSVPSGRDACALAEYQETLGKRVSCFRKFVDACHRAPEELVDSVLPDAYQVDSFEPLVPLEQPTLHADERAERRDWVASKAGLVRLYNDLLALHIPIGVVTRFVRRYLGCRAASSIGRSSLIGAMQRALGYLTECMKIWLLIGENLSRFAPLLPIIVQPMLPDFVGGRYNAKHQSAESIMFRFSVTDWLIRTSKALASFVLLLNIWVFLSLAALSPLILWAIGLLPASDSGGSALSIAAAIVVLIIIAPLLPSALKLRGAEFVRAVRSLGKGLFVFAYCLTKWSLVMAALSVLFGSLVGAVVSMAWAEGFVTASIYLFLAGLTATLTLVVLASAVHAAFTKATVRDFFHFSMQATMLAGFVAFLPLALLLSVENVAGILPSVLDRLGLASQFVQLRNNLGIESLTTLAEAGPQTFGEFAALTGSYAAFVILLVMATVIGIVALTGVFVAFAYLTRHDRSSAKGAWLVRRFFEHYRLGPSLAHCYGLKKFLIDLFDRDYYGACGIADAAKVALGGPAPTGQSRTHRSRPRKRIVDYTDTSEGRPAIRLGLAAADLRSGKLDVIGNKHTVIDGLLAATAIPPIFPPKQLGPDYYIDAANVGNIPTRPLMKLLRKTPIHENIAALHVYAVDPLPVSHEELSPPLDAQGKEKDTPYLNLIDTATRALQIQRFRDAKVERKLTSIFTGTLPSAKSVVTIHQNGREKSFYRAYIAPVELDRPISLNKKILYAKKQKRRDELAETIAMGCRAALQVMLAETLTDEKSLKDAVKKSGETFIKCNDAIDAYKSRLDGIPPIELPGCGGSGPGVSEICKHCSIRNSVGEIIEDPADKKKLATQYLRIPKDGKSRNSKLPKQIVDWPQELDTSGRGLTAAPPNDPTPTEAPDHKTKTKPTKLFEPSRVVTFGGGVFRGVFQMGVLNALALAKLKPTLVAGASVGSITAAMAASILDETDRHRQTKKIVDLAAVYLAMDRLILTDRFADFIRNWTIRASEARFSISDADAVFRKYDFGSTKAFQHKLRAVVAGLERLFYVNPFQLNRVVSAARHRDISTLTETLKERAQDWLDRMNVGTEVLGAEPLRELIEDFVLKSGKDEHLHATLLSELSPNMRLIATTTNLTRGELRVLGSTDDEKDGGVGITLVEALLASSAFPGVFRPRQSWDLLPGDNREHEYVDGGIVDNLPLEPTLKEIRDLAEDDAATLSVRPASPHLMVAISLEPGNRPISSAESDELTAYWPGLLARTRELKHNVKLDMYKSSLRDVNDLYAELTERKLKPVRTPLDVKLLAVKPRWLCSTFAFHPMLGFRRDTQAKSIAHGCASTLRALAELKESAQAWHLDPRGIPEVKRFRDVPPAQREKSRFRDGKCWLLPDAECPFSKRQLKGSLDDESAAWVSEIHRHCWNTKTHTRNALHGGGFWASRKKRDSNRQPSNNPAQSNGTETPQP